MIDNIGTIQLPINRLHMELTNYCNFSCEFCPNSKINRTRGIMSLEMARSILNDVKKNNIAKLILFHVMGEPTLHPDLIEIVSYATEKGLDTCLTTNGSRLDNRLVSELIHAGIGRIIVSLQTPDSKSFSLRSAKGISFDDYTERIISISKYFLLNDVKAKLFISFLSTPLRRLIIPVLPEISIADRSSDLKKHLISWSEKIIKDTPFEKRTDEILRQIRKIRSFKENIIGISDNLFLSTRILGDWSKDPGLRNVNAKYGYCPGIRENFGILWNGDYTFCCTDFDGNTSVNNYNDTPIKEFLGKEEVQSVIKAFNSFKVVNPYCKHCLGDKNYLNAIVKQLGSIVYFKLVRNIMNI